MLETRVYGRYMKEIFTGLKLKRQAAGKHMTDSLFLAACLLFFTIWSFKRLLHYSFQPAQRILVGAGALEDR